MDTHQSNIGTQGRSKIAELCALLRDDILRGRLGLGEPLPSQSKLSKKYGVSEGTAGAAVGRLAQEGLAVRVFGRGSFVAEELPVQHKVIDFIRMRRPPEKGEKPGTLLWIELLTNAAQRAGRVPHWYHLAYEELERVEEVLGRLSESRGIVIFGAVPPMLPLLLCQRGIPVLTVLSASGKREATQYPQIAHDRREESRMATEHLVSLGYSRIGYVRSGSPLNDAGFLDVLEQHKLAVRGDWFLDIGRDINQIGDEVHKLCRALFEKMLKDPDRPEAMVCPNLHPAHLLELTALEMGLRIPEDLAIVRTGPEGPSIFGKVPVPLTTVAFSMDQTCQKAVELVEQIHAEPMGMNSPLQEPHLMPLELIVADSSKPKSQCLVGNNSAIRADGRTEKEKGCIGS